MERETKREKLLETKMREAKLKVRVAMNTSKTSDGNAISQKDEEELSEYSISLKAPSQHC